MTTLLRQKLSRVTFKALLLFISILFFTACTNLASGGKEYERITIEIDSEYYIYSCEKNFSDTNTSIQAHNAHTYLFGNIEMEAENMMRPIFDKLDDEEYRENEELSWLDWFSLLIESFKMQSNITQHAKDIEKKFGCVFIEVVE